MWSRRPAFLVLAALLIAAALALVRGREISEVAVTRCVALYAARLPENARVGFARREGSELVVQVRHLDWTGELRCALYRDGSIDDAGTRSGPDGVRWVEPPPPTNP